AHYNPHVLAELIRAGALVVMTNFDRLIEIAWNRLYGGDGPPLRVAAFSHDFPENLPNRNQPTLWKLHGSLSIDGRDTRNSIQAWGICRNSRRDLEPARTEHHTGVSERRIVKPVEQKTRH